MRVTVIFKTRYIFGRTFYTGYLPSTPNTSCLQFTFQQTETFRSGQETSQNRWADNALRGQLAKLVPACNSPSTLICFYPKLIDSVINVISIAEPCAGAGALPSMRSTNLLARQPYLPRNQGLTSTIGPTLFLISRPEKYKLRHATLRYVHRSTSDMSNFSI